MKLRKCCPMRKNSALTPQTLEVLGVLFAPPEPSPVKQPETPPEQPALVEIPTPEEAP